MKTSNIILLGFLITIFAIPLMLIASLNSKIKNKQYTVVKNQYELYVPMVREGELPSYSVISIKSPDPEFLECHLSKSDSGYYRYEKEGKNDSIAIYASNDTLYVHYLPLKDSTGKELRNGHKLELNLKVKSLGKVIVDGADVYLNGVDTNEGFNLILKNNGKITDVKNVDLQDNSSTEPAKSIRVNPQAVAEMDSKDQIMEMAELRSSANNEIKDLLIFHLM